MFTDKAQALLDRAKDYGNRAAARELDLRSLLAAISEDSESSVLLAQCFHRPTNELRADMPKFSPPVTCPGKLPLAEGTRTALAEAKSLAAKVPDRVHPGFVDIRHLVCALATCREFCLELKVGPITPEEAISQLISWYESNSSSLNLEELTERLRSLRSELLSKVFGQDHAVHAFIEGLFNAEVVATADLARKAPRSLFVFAGPPGVGKTFLAELGASHLDRPFKRFDMSAYSGHQQNEALVGMGRSYIGAHSGVLTEFVEKNPNAILLFDEIEKAHVNTIHLFLQILDAGVLEDKFQERDVIFKDTTIIFTTNAGKRLYDNPNQSGINRANAAFHRRTVLDALENETNTRTGEPFFPPAICSRMATGYPILFNHLGIDELGRVVESEIHRVGSLIEAQHYKLVTFDDRVPLCLVLREGSKPDARMVKSQAESFVKGEVFKFCNLFKIERLENALEGVSRIHLALDEDDHGFAPEIQQLFETSEKPRVLFIGDRDLEDLLRDTVSEINWSFADSANEAMEMLALEETDLVLLDLWLGRLTTSRALSVQHFDHVPAASRQLDLGQEILRTIHDRLPNVPVFLLSLIESDDNDSSDGTIDEELFLACVRGGGSRGLIQCRFVDMMTSGWESHRDQFTADLKRTVRRLHREKMAGRLGQERKVLSFDTAPRMDEANRAVNIRLRNLRLGRAVAAADAGEMVEDVERPSTRFDEVIGADAAKEELKFFIDYLKNPRRFAALGLKPPKGVLLHGPPGTGKTMLARAMAGESNVAFIAAAATNFVTIWQGSGPQNVRDLFARARRYAPSIVFIDEIDAIGRVRTGGGSAHATEETLNALLTELDGFTSPLPDRPVFVLSATNFKVDSDDQESPERSTRTLDPALVRRFSRTILVDLPERSAREKYLRVRLEGRRNCSISNETIKLISDRSTGMSIANLESVIETAARHAAKLGSDLTGELLEEAFETVRYGESKARDPVSVRRTAIHEAGHTVLYWLCGRWPSYVTVVARGDHGGYMAPSSEDAEEGSHSRQDLLAKIRVALAGRAAELLAFGAEEGLTTGAVGDLERATHIARQIVCRFGMSEDFGLLVTPEIFKYEGALSSTVYLRINEVAGRILKEEMERTREMLEENQIHLDAVAEELIKKERLTGEDLLDILPALVGPAVRRGTEAL